MNVSEVDRDGKAVPVAVAEDKFRKGVRRPGELGETWDWREPRGPLNTRGIRAEFDLMPLDQMVATYRRTDAHFVAYTVLDQDGRPYDRQPRVLKPALEWLIASGHHVTAQVLVVDIDNPGHREWTDEDRERAAVEHACVPELQTVGVYSTRHGRRLMQPLTTPLDVELFERTVRAYLLALDAAGVVGVDHACSDWTRHYRVARCMRKGHYDPPWWDDLTRMVPIDPPRPVGAVPRQRKAAQGSVGHRPAVEPLWSVDVPPMYRELVADLGAVVATVDDEWHRLFLAISGALLERGVPPEHVPAIVGGASVESKRDDRPDSRYAGAQTTVRRWQENLVFKGFTTLLKLEPRVAAVVARHTATAPEQRVQGQIDQARVSAAPTSPIETATLGIRRTIASAYGLVAIEAGCGVGKSQAALAVAEERSKKTAKSEDATGGRAPTGSKTAISCPTHALAIQHTQNLRRRGVPVMRVFGPLSVLREDGTPECRHHEAGVELAAGGQSVSWEFCRGRDKRRCDYWDECRARDGVDADDDARVVIGTHQKLPSLSEEVGTSGLLVVDEPPEPIVDTTITLRDISVCLSSQNDFVPSYWAVALPLIVAARAALATGTVTRSDAAHSASAVLALGWSAVPEAVIREALEEAGDMDPLEGTDTMARVFAAQPIALHEEAKSDAPPLRRASVYVARDVPAVAARIGTASAVVHALWRSATQDPPASLRITEIRGQHGLTVSLIDQGYVATLQRAAPTVLIDACLALHHPIAEQIVRAKVPLHRFAAPDGAPCTRELWLEPKARRAHWLTAGASEARWPVWSRTTGVVRAVEAIVAAAVERGLRKVAIISVLPVAKCLRVALGEAPPAGMPPEVADAAREYLAPLLARAPEIRWMIGHYGAMRGLDAMATCDGLVTLMDPVPNLGTVQHAAAYYRSTLTWEQYVEIVCGAELEQAHGRLRHPHRLTPSWACHIGTTLPRGYGWDLPEVVVVRDRLRRLPSAMGAEELLDLKGQLPVTVFAAAVGLRRDDIQKYLSGDRPVPHDVAVLLRKWGERRPGS